MKVMDMARRIKPGGYANVRASPARFSTVISAFAVVLSAWQTIRVKFEVIGRITEVMRR
jgi:hypothetical protein